MSSPRSAPGGVGGGLGLRFDQAAVLAGGAILEVQQRVADLVEEGLDAHCRRHLGVDADLARSALGVAVEAVLLDVLECDIPSPSGDELLELVEEAVDVVTLEVGGGLLGQRVAIGIADVEDRQHRVDDAAAGGLLAGGLVLLYDPLGGVAEDLDRLRALHDVTAQGLPLPVAEAMRAALGEDEHLVGERPPADGAGEAQPRFPVLALRQCGDLRGELLVQRLGLRAALLGRAASGATGLGGGHGVLPRCDLP